MACSMDVTRSMLHPCVFPHTNRDLYSDVVISHANSLRDKCLIKLREGTRWLDRGRTAE